MTLILAGLVLAFFWFMLQKRKYNLPPGPATLPLVGNLPQLDKKQPFKSFTEVSYKKKIFGKCMIPYNDEFNRMFSKILKENIYLFPAEQKLWSCYDTLLGLAAHSCSDRI